MDQVLNKYPPVTTNEVAAQAQSSQESCMLQPATYLTVAVGYPTLKSKKGCSQVFHIQQWRQEVATGNWQQVPKLSKRTFA